MLPARDGLDPIELTGADDVLVIVVPLSAEPVDAVLNVPLPELLPVLLKRLRIAVEKAGDDVGEKAALSVVFETGGFGIRFGSKKP
jgi:hypothetical protein